MAWSQKELVWVFENKLLFYWDIFPCTSLWGSWRLVQRENKTQITTCEKNDRLRSMLWSTLCSTAGSHSTWIPLKFIRTQSQPEHLWDKNLVELLPCEMIELELNFNSIGDTSSYLIKWPWNVFRNVKYTCDVIDSVDPHIQHDGTIQNTATQLKQTVQRQSSHIGFTPPLPTVLHILLKL